MRKFNKKTKLRKPKQKSVKKTEKRKIGDHFVTKRKAKSPASWQNLGLD